MALGALWWLSASTFFLFFAGVLLAVFLRAVVDLIRHYLPLSENWALTLTIVALLGLLTGAGFLLAPKIQEQARSLATELPRAATEIEKRLQQYSWGPALLQASLDVQNTIWRFPAGLVSSITGAMTAIVVVLFVGLYLAAAPDRYAEGLLRLVPRPRRNRSREILTESGWMLRRWLMTQLLLMGTNTVVISIGLSLLNVPLAVSLGIISGLLNFVPNFGPIIAAVPAVLLALLVNPTTAIYVALFFFVYQMFDGYVLTPLVQDRSVCLPPAVTIMSQVLLGVLFGSMGVVFAVPLLAVVLVVVKMAYVEDVLHEHAGHCDGGGTH